MMRFRTLWLISLLTLLLAGLPVYGQQQGSRPPPAALTRADVDTWLDGYLPYALRTGDLPGAVVVVVNGSEVVTARGFGYADAQQRTPVDPERTLFRPGSVSKLVTWTAVMQQVERGKLDLDADVNTYLDFRIPPRDGKPVTLRQILTHTAGFEEQTKHILFYDATNLRPLGDLLKSWTPERIFAPGTTPAYSNWATSLAGYVVERTSGMPFEDYVEREIFAPLGMRSATFRQPLPPALAAQMSAGYPKSGEPSSGFELIGPAPAGALTASGTDMARFMLAHLHEGELDGRRILSASTAAAMHDSSLTRVDRASLLPPLNRMELGFFETNVNGREVIGHLGDTSAFHTSLHLFMKEGAGLYVSFNGTGKAGAAQTLRSALFHDFADRYFPEVGPPDGRVDAVTAAQHAQRMAGVWQNSRRSESSFFAALGLFGQTKVAVGNKGQLAIAALTGPSGRPREWVEIAPFVWRDRDGQDRLAAQVVDGKVVRWSMDFMSPFMVFDRVPAGKSSAWILPALYVSLAVLLLTLLSWPIGWGIRRAFRVPLTLAAPARLVRRGTRAAAGLVLAVLAGWAGVVTAMLGNLKNAGGSFDKWLWLLQALGLVVFAGAVGVALWNVRVAWRDGRGARAWGGRVWSVLLALSCGLVLYIAARFGLIAMTTNY